MESAPRYLTAALYKFVDLPDFEALREPLQACCEAHQVKGTLLLASEGINGTIAGLEPGVRAVLAHRGAHHNAGGGGRVGGISQAPAAIRSDQLVVSHPGGSTRLRYVSCPFAPFLDSSQQNVCSAP